MQTFELDNNRLIKNLLQLLGVNEEALAREIGASKEEFHSWKRGTEIPAKFKRKMQHMTRVAEFGKSFMTLMEKMGQDIENGIFPEGEDQDILSEGEAALAQAINSAMDSELSYQHFMLWDAHNHFTVGSLFGLFQHETFSAYVTRQTQDTIEIDHDFLSAFIDHSNILADWVCEKNGIDSLDVLPCEIAHTIISIIAHLTCGGLVEKGFDSDYEGSSFCEYLKQKAENDIFHLIEMIKMIDGQINVNYYRLLESVDYIAYELDMEISKEEYSDSDESNKIDRHLSFETREILKGQRKIMEGLDLTSALHEFEIRDQSTLMALVKATRELERLNKELNESGSALKVNENVLRECSNTISKHGFVK